MRERLSEKDFEAEGDPSLVRSPLLIWPGGADQLPSSVYRCVRGCVWIFGIFGDD